MNPPSRRTFGAIGLRTLLMASLFRRSVHADALGGTLRSGVRPWLVQIDELSAALSSGTIPPGAWQAQVADVLGKMELRDFLKSLDFERLAGKARFPFEGEAMQRLYVPDPDGRLQALAFRPFLVSLQRGTAIVPHGHHNMATMHMVLDGRARVRHFDKLDASPSHLTMRPAADEVCGPGAVGSISDEHRNIHWFEAVTDRVFMFNIGVYQVRPGPFGERDYVDPEGGTPMGGGIIRAPRLERSAAYAKYGHA